MMNLTSMKNAAKRAFCGQGGGSVLLRRFGALVLALCLLAAIPMDAAADGQAPTEATSGSDDDYVVISGLTTIAGEKDRTDLRNFLTDLSITDSEGKTVDPNGGTLYVGEKYTIQLRFGEGGQQSLQFSDESDTLTYQIPKAFKVEPVEDQPLTISVDGVEVVIGYYSIDGDGKLTLHLTEEGKKEISGTYDTSFIFKMTAEAVPLTDSGDGTVDFGGTGKNFHFEVVDQPLVDVTKEGKYAELGREGGKLSYTVTTKVKHGQVKDVVLTDALTPPESDAFVLNEVNPDDVTVTFRRKNVEGEDEVIELTSPEGYTLEEVTDPNFTGKKTFQVKLKEPYASMQEGDEVSLTYKYGVKYNLKSAQKLWAEVANEATVTGNMEIKDPANPEGEPTKKGLTEKDKNSVEMRVTPPGKGIVSKDQEYSELTNTLHYTLYTTVPAGTWTPMFIFDDMYVQYQGERWYFQEFLPTGRVKNLEVRAADLPADWFNGLEGATDAEKLEKLQKTIEEAKASDPLRGWQLDHGQFGWDWKNYLPADYDPEDMDQYVARLGGRELNIVFGYNGWTQWGEWGYWTITDHDRLIVTEYDLDMSTTLGDKITLVDMNDETRTIELSPEEILRAGITNNVRLHYGPYNPGYSVFFNNADEINKSGEVRKNGKDVYIDYTVTMNTTDESVRGYFHDVATDWYSSARKTDGEKEWKDWDYDTNGNVQAEFYDYLPGGWEYVEDSLYMTAKTSFGTERRMTLNPNVDLQLLDGDGNICAPLVFFVGEPGFVDSFVNYDRIDTIEIVFHYTLKATEEWLAKNRNDNGVEVDNHAAIKDNKELGERWSADNQEYYYPDKLTKDAVQVDEGGNLLRFTLDINPDGEKFVQEGFKEAQTYLIVTDKSTNLQIQEGTITVRDADGIELTGVGQVDQSALVKNDDWKENEWGTLPPDEDGQFKLVVPNGKHLTVTYEAVITVSGDNVQVSNEAGIEGVERSKSNYEGSLVVSDIKSGGSASQYSLNFIKKDGNTKEGLAGAEFNFYVVLKYGSALDKPENEDKIRSFTIDGDTYRGYSADDWVIKTGDGGRFEITRSMNWLEPGSYYILEETKAPEGYMKLEKPILFYFGLANDAEAKTHPGAELAVPNGWLAVENTPIQALRVVKKGIAGEDPFPLEGAQFQLCEAEKTGEDAYVPDDGGKSYTGQSEGELGSVRWGDGGEELKLTPDKYYILTETKAPDGYILVEGQIVLCMAKDGRLQVVSAPEGVTYPEGPTDEPVFGITVTDPSSYVLPESGGAGTATLYALGSALVITAALALACDARRRKTRG